MLYKFIEVGEQYYNFESKKIKYIDKSCCKNEECIVFDFDKIKDKVVQVHSLQTLSSCDALSICINKDCLDFIEMKGFEDFKKSNPKEKKIDKQISKFDFKKKIEDSLYLLQTILNSSNFKATKDDQNKYQNIKKRYFIATDINIEDNALDGFIITMDFLSTTSNIDKYLTIKLQDKIKDIDNIEIEKPRLIECKNLCSNICK